MPEKYIYRSKYLPIYDKYLIRDALIYYKAELKLDLEFLKSTEHIKDCAFCRSDKNRNCIGYYVCFNRLEECKLLI